MRAILWDPSSLLSRTMETVSTRPFPCFLDSVDVVTCRRSPRGLRSSGRLVEMMHGAPAEVTRSSRFKVGTVLFVHVWRVITVDQLEDVETAVL